MTPSPPPMAPSRRQPPRRQPPRRQPPPPRPGAPTSLDAKVWDRRRRRLIRWGWLALVVVVAATVVWAVWLSSLMTVRQVEVEGISGAEAAAVRDLAAVPMGGPLARVDTGAVAHRVRGKITVAQAEVSRSWPSTIRIVVTPRTARIVARGADGSLQLVDATGVAFATVSQAPAGLPVVTVTSPEGADRAALKAALSVIAQLPPDLATQVGSLEVSSPSHVTFQIGQVTVIWGGGDRAERKAEVLRVLLGTHPATIDVSTPDTPTTT